MKKLLLIILSTAFVRYHSYSQSNKPIEVNSINKSISNCYHFSVGWAIQATRYSTGDRDFERPFLNGMFTPGNELQISFHITENLAVTTGANYQVIAIHSKEQTIKIIENAIRHFEELKESQKNKIISISKKYGMEDKAIEYINANKKIQYYGGVFDLYNPYPVIDKWKQKLEKIKQNTKRQ